LDKDGAYIDGSRALGFGSIEIGTVTPRAQPGNPQPRMFRLPKAEAIINPWDSITAALMHSSTMCSHRVLSGKARRTRPEHRQERRHADRTCRRRLSALPAKVYPYAVM
jgi:hypothetical protein